MSYQDLQPPSSVVFFWDQIHIHYLRPSTIFQNLPSKAQDTSDGFLMSLYFRALINLIACIYISVAGTHLPSTFHHNQHYLPKQAILTNTPLTSPLWHEMSLRNGLFGVEGNSTKALRDHFNGRDTDIYRGWLIFSRFTSRQKKMNDYRFGKRSM